MAYFSGKTYGYLNQQLDKYFTSSLTIWLVAIIIFVTASVYSFLHKNNYIVTYSLAAVLITFFFVFKALFKKWTGKTFAYLQGIKGENAIANILTQLSNDYRVYKNVTLPGNLADLDFIVVGPTGIFTIEVKSHKGVIGYDEHKLTINGHNFKGNIIDQVQQGYWGLHNYLTRETGLDVFVTPILVFSDDRTVVRLGSQKINHMHIINKQWLLKIIDQHEWQNYQDEKELVNNAINKLTNMKLQEL